VVKMLLAMDGIGINHADGDNKTPLYHAAQNGHKEIVEMLPAIDDIDLNTIATAEGTTPLLEAARSGIKEIVKLLLTVDGSDLNLVDTKYARTPLL
jgi:ankyrin repeat protein